MIQVLLRKTVLTIDPFTKVVFTRDTFLMVMFSQVELRKVVLMKKEKSEGV